MQHNDCLWTSCCDQESSRIATIYIDSEYHLEHRSKQGYKALLFDSPPGIRVFDSDCQAAGIAKNDARGHVIDIHALRTTFGTHLAVAGVHPCVAQAAMRHSRNELTTNFYTDFASLDAIGAVNALSDFARKTC